MSAARYTLGIDLGTTHCALSYVDLEASDGDQAAQQVLEIPQLTGPGSIEGRPLLPPSSTCRTPTSSPPAT